MGKYTKMAKMKRDSKLIAKWRRDKAEKAGLNALGVLRYWAAEWRRLNALCAVPKSEIEDPFHDVIPTPQDKRKNFVLGKSGDEKT